VIEDIQNAIITELQKITSVMTVGVWQGDVDELMSMPQRLPALFVIYQGAEFEEKRVIGSNRADHRMDFLIVLVCRSLKSRSDGASVAYEVIEAVRSALIGYQISGYGWLWPVKEDLVMSEGGLLVYGLTYRMNTMT